MSHYIHGQPPTYPARLLSSVQHLSHLAVQRHSLSVATSLWQVEKAATPARLTRMVNHLQEHLSRLTPVEQMSPREQLVALLSTHVSQAPTTSLRLEAAHWLRILLQAGLVTQPAQIFVTLVTAAANVTDAEEAAAEERLGYVKMIFDCFWAFRYPYPAFPWKDFPANEIFYPLAPLFEQADVSLQETLLAIFAELTTLNDTEIVSYLLPVALSRAEHADPQYRSSVAPILARINHQEAQEAFCCLLTDSDAGVRASARRAADYIRKG